MSGSNKQLQRAFGFWKETQMSFLSVIGLHPVHRHREPDPWQQHQSPTEHIHSSVVPGAGDVNNPHDCTGAARRQQTSELFTVLQPLWVSLWHVEDGQFTDVVYLYHYLFPGRSLQSLYSVIFQPSPDLLHVFCVLYPFWNKANQDRSGPVQPATLLRTGLFFHVRISAGSHDSLPVYISDFLKTAMMDYIDSLRVACWHRRSNRTLGSFTPLKYVQNTVFSLWPAQISILRVWCSAIRLSLQTLHLNVTKPKPFSCQWKFSVIRVRVTKFCVAGNWTCFTFTSISVRLSTDPTISESEWLK